MYKRTSQGREEFSSCNSIRLIYDHPDLGLVAGQAVSFVGGPRTDEDFALIASEDWVELPPPPPQEPQPQYYPSEGEQLSALLSLSSLKSEIVALDDEAAQYVAALFTAWESMTGKPVHEGERYYFDCKLWKVLQDHTVQADWRPDTSPSLFVRVFVDEWPPIPESIPSTAPYMTGDKGTWQGEHYICKIDNCVWTPAAYPQAWEKQTT